MVTIALICSDGAVRIREKWFGTRYCRKGISLDCRRQRVKEEEKNISRYLGWLPIDPTAIHRLATSYPIHQ